MTWLAQVDRPLFDPGWFDDRNLERVRDLSVQHVRLTVLAVIIGLLLALPMAVLAVRRRRLYSPLLATTGVLFTIPSAALFILLLAYSPFGLSTTTSLIGLVIYTLLILFRNAVAGFDSVAREVREAAEAMGYTSRQMLRRVELPLALPIIMAGVRIATVTTIGLVTVTAFIGQGGYGQFFIQGFNRRNTTEVLVGVILSVLLATLADLALLVVERRMTPWSQARVQQ